MEQVQQGNQHPSVDTKLITSLFGQFSVPIDFEFMKSVKDCKEEKLIPLVDSFIYENKFTLMHGAKNTNKTWIATYAAICVASGHDFFDVPVIKGDVAYVYGESNMVSRIHMICSGMEIEVPENLYLHSLRADLTENMEIQRLKSSVPPDVKLMVIDNFEKYWLSDVDDNIVNSAMRFIREIRERVAVLLIHHDPKETSSNTRKFNRARGSGKIPNNADATVSLKMKKNDVQCEFYSRDGREPDPMKIILNFDDEDNSVVFKNERNLPLVNSKAGNLDKWVEEAMNLIRSKVNKPFGKTNLYDDVLKGNGICSSKDYYSKLFPELLRRGLLKTDGNKHVLNDTN